MKLRRSLILAGIFLLFAGTFAAAEDSDYLSKKNAVGVRIGYHLYDSNDTIDYWQMDKSDFSSAIGEITYERSLSKRFGIDFSVGFFETDDNFDSCKRISGSGYYIDVYPQSNTKVRNIFFSPTLKVYLSLSDSVLLYAGAGPDYCYSEAEFQWRLDVNDGTTTYDLTINETDNRHSFGAHGLVGIEYYFYKDPKSHGAFDAPVSLFFEYKYATINVGDFDEKVVDNIHANSGVSIGKHDWNVGGHYVYVGLRWHF
ncbi:MAG: outer membrane beta-barrel protein [Deltaproteobacteria bacterium]|nr:outer membrane beta-barrel protein [Deltaproteobacteria bacterium]